MNLYQNALEYVYAKICWLSCLLQAYEYIALRNQPKIKQFSCVLATA